MSKKVSDEVGERGLACRSSLPQIAALLPRLALASLDKKRVAPQGRRNVYRTLFLSDLHLGAQGCRAERILDFLDAHHAETLYLVGDIFDDRFSFRSYWSPIHDAILQSLLSKVRDGGRIVFIPGNHDADFPRHCGDYIDRIEVVQKAIHTAADGRRYVVVHGDCFDMVIKHALWLSHIGGHVDFAMRSLNSVLRRATRFFGFGDLAIVEAITSAVNFVITRGDLFGQRLVALASEHVADGVICGHFHRPAMHDRFGIAYINCGDWIDNCTAVAEDAGGRLQIISWKSPIREPALANYAIEACGASMIGA